MAFVVSAKHLNVLDVACPIRVPLDVAHDREALFGGGPDDHSLCRLLRHY
jgi:hypothetical protein